MAVFSPFASLASPGLVALWGAGSVVLPVFWPWPPASLPSLLRLAVPDRQAQEASLCLIFKKKKNGNLIPPEIGII